MRWCISASTVLHILVVMIAWVGLPHLKRDPPPTETPIMVEIARISDVTNPPPPTQAPPKEEPKKQEEPKPAPQQPPKPVAAPPPPPPPRQPSEPEPKVAAVPPPPEPKQKPKEKPPEPEAKPPVPKPSPVLDKAKPKRKPQPPDAFASVLKTVDQLKQQAKPEKPDPKAKPKEEPKKDQFENQIAKAIQNPSKMHDPTRDMSMSEIDLVRQQIYKCWNVPAGAKGARDMAVEIAVTMNQDGTVRRAEIQNSGRTYSDPFYRAAAESALRAVLNPQCQPYKLSPDKYYRWKDIVLVFDPREML